MKLILDAAACADMMKPLAVLAALGEGPKSYMEIHASRAVILTAFGFGVCRVRLPKNAAEVKEPGRAMVHGATLAGLLARSPTERMELRVGERGAVLAAGRNRYHVASLDGQAIEFNDQSAAGVMVAADEFCAALRMVRHAMPTQDAREYLNGVHLRALGNRLALEATDGHRAASAKVQCEGDDTLDVILPAAAAQKMEQLLRGQESLQLQHGENLVLVASSGAESLRGLVWQCPVVAGQYPDLVAAVGSRFAGASAVVESKSLLDAVIRLMLVLAGPVECPVAVELEMSGDGLLLTIPYGSDTKEWLALENVQVLRPHRIRVSPRYLAQAVQALGAERLRLEMPDTPDGPLLLADGSPEDGKWAAVMAMRIVAPAPLAGGT
jgi:hypothetical protein